MLLLRLEFKFEFLFVELASLMLYLGATKYGRRVEIGDNPVYTQDTW